MQLITQTIDSPAMLGIAPDVEAKRNALCLASREIKSVSNPVEQDAAVGAARAIRTWLKEIEAARVALTKPLIETQRRLKALADDHCAPLLDEQSRVERLLTAFQQAEAKRIAEEVEARRVAIAFAERAAREAEEAARQAALVTSDFESIIAAETAREVAVAAEAGAKEAITVPILEVSKATGAATRRELCFEVTDLDAFSKARPDLCKIEPKPSAIKAVCVPEMPNLPPGLRLWWELKTSVRTY